VLTVGVSLVVSLVLNLILIPKYGIESAAWVSVIVHLVLFGMYFYYSKQEVPSIRLLGTSNIIIFLAATIIYTMIHFLTNGGYVIVGIGVIMWGAVVYVVMKQGGNYAFLKQVLREKGVG